ncbi:ribonuclease P protein subunit p20-like [Argiope bruennichi]|uniref:Ribonuclease P protein subunit p20 n=1 Tax=Argiope bruennichi TaxID=94029 RepID=A0A8T0DYI7_ARGBR|nr:ribonuclease P protein subunit p20-like [Argiope bruennichi]KAF8763572.1 Ribonuclease P protein subunit p20 like protein [Argiope bruennichi]
MEGTKKIRKSPKPNNEGENRTSRSNRADSFDSDYRIERRPTPRLPKRKNDVYVNQKTPFMGQFNKCKSLLNNEKEIIIHGLGAAVNTAVNLALQLKTFYSDTVTLEATTSTVDLIDDHHFSSGDYRAESRKNSAIHIKLAHVTASN